MGLFDSIRRVVGGGDGTAESDDGPTQPDVVDTRDLDASALRERAEGVAGEVDVLDFSLSSLAQFDDAIDEGYDEDLATSDTPGAYATDTVRFGCYFGEVLVRAYGGEWTRTPDWGVTVTGPEGTTTVAVFDVAERSITTGAVFAAVADRAAVEVGLDGDPAEGDPGDEPDAATDEREPAANDGIADAPSATEETEDDGAADEPSADTPDPDTATHSPDPDGADPATTGADGAAAVADTESLIKEAEPTPDEPSEPTPDEPAADPDSSTTAEDSPSLFEEDDGDASPSLFEGESTGAGPTVADAPSADDGPPASDSGGRDAAAPAGTDSATGPADDRGADPTAGDGLRATYAEAAEELVSFWTEYDLDYTPDSLERLDDLVSEEWDDERFDDADFGSDDSFDDRVFTSVSTELGSYFGEVLVRELDAEWRDEATTDGVVVEGADGPLAIPVFKVAGTSIKQQPVFARSYDSLLSDLESDG